MAPEQLKCILGHRQPVDERSDLYAVGIILFELLTGRFPFDRPRSTDKNYLQEMLANRLKSPPSLRKRNPNVTPAVEGIVRKLLDPEPSRRYSRAIYLQEDLDRQLADQPLRYASERSPRERLGKWRRRNPKLATGLLVALAATLFLILPATTIAIRVKQSAESRRLIETHEARDALAQTEIDSRDVRASLTTRLGDRKLIESGLAKARAVLDRYEIGQNDAWREAPRFARLSEDEQRRLVEIVGQALLLSARGEALLAEDAKSRRPEDAANHLKTALNLNDAAKSLFRDRPPRSLWKQRSDFLLAAGNKADAKEIEGAIRSAASQSDFDQYVEAADLAASGNYKESLAKIEPVVLRNPTDFAAWFVQGLCHSALDHFADAAECYSVCVALQPNSHMAYLNRGIMRLRQGDRRRAEMDFSRCIELKPKDVDAWVNRALARLDLKKLTEAERDLTEAMKLPEAPTRVYFIRSLVRDRIGDKRGAASDRAEGMRRTPEDSLSWITRGFQRQASDAKAALHDYEAALDLNPRSRDALINMANVLSENLKQPEKALEVFARTIELWPDDLDAHGSRGVVLARLGKIDPARRDAEFCLEHSESPFVCFQMAGLYAQVSRHSKSAEDRRWALHLLAMSLRKGFDRLDLVAGDPDLEPIRGEPEYRRLAELARSLAQESGR